MIIAAISLLDCPQVTGIYEGAVTALAPTEFGIWLMSTNYKPSITEL